MSSILDASALLAFLNSETGAGTVADHIARGALVSSVNLAEVIAKLNERGMPLEEIKRTISDLGLQVAAYDEAQAYTTGELWKLTKHGGLSLGDRACLALGIKENGVVLTADRAWKAASHIPGLTIEQIR